MAGNYQPFNSTDYGWNWEKYGFKAQGPRRRKYYTTPKSGYPGGYPRSMNAKPSPAFEPFMGKNYGTFRRRNPAAAAARFQPYNPANVGYQTPDGLNPFRRRRYGYNSYPTNDLGRKPAVTSGAKSSLYRPQWKGSKFERQPAALTERQSPTKSADTPSGAATARTYVLGDPINGTTNPSAYLTPSCNNVLFDVSDAVGDSGFAAYQMMIMNAISAGGTIAQRLGRTIKMKSFLVKGSFIPLNSNLGSATDGQSGRLRIAVIYDRQFNGVKPLWSDIFAYVDTGTNGLPNGQTANPSLAQLKTDAWAPPNPNNTYRFLVLRDCMYDFQPFTLNLNAIDTFQQWVLNSVMIEGNACGFYRSIGGLETQYKGDSSNYSDISSGALYVVMQSDINWDIGGGEATPLLYQLAARVRFVDAL